MNLRNLALAAVALALSSCATTAQRIDAAADVHALLVSIRDNDRATFEAHVDRTALKRSIESRLLQETRRSSAHDALKALGVILAPGLAELAGETLVQPRVFRAVAEYYGYEPGDPLPNALVIASSLRHLQNGRVCATRTQGGPCLLTFTESAGVWKLSSFDGDLSMLRVGR